MVDMSSHITLLRYTFTFCLTSYVTLSFSADLTARATFSQKGIEGNITFTQSTPLSPTNITVTLTGLSQGSLYSWHVHQYPFTAALISPCSSASVGGHYDPLGASTRPNYRINCNPSNVTGCEIGDLSGKFGSLNETLLPLVLSDGTLSLYGRHSIVGRSVVIHLQNGSRFVCANVLGDADETRVIASSYVPVRGSSIVGNIFMFQYSFNSTTVFADLFSGNSTQDHNWHVHQNPVSPVDITCQSTGGHYNPRNVNTTSVNYSLLCNASVPLQCEVGDLSSKGSGISFNSNYQGRLQYTDIDLPIAPDEDGYSITNRSIVIHEMGEGGARVACGNTTSLIPREAVAIFDGEEGITGTIRFTQKSPFEPTIINVNINGLEQLAGGYHVHETPIGEGDRVTGRARCSLGYTGGHWNPRGVSYVGTSPDTSDQYELGDLSGKFGTLAGQTNTIEQFSDPNLPLFGVDSIIGRSVVIHFATNGSRWACANIEYATPTVQASGLFSIYGHMIEVLLIQPVGDPYADTTIIIKNSTLTEIPSISPSLVISSLTSSFLSALSYSSLLLAPSLSSFVTLSLSPSSIAPSLSFMSPSPSIMSPSLSSMSPSLSFMSLSPSLMSPSSSIMSPSVSFMSPSPSSIVSLLISSTLVSSLLTLDESPSPSPLPSPSPSASLLLSFLPSPSLLLSSSSINSGNMRRRRFVDDDLMVDAEEETVKEVHHLVRRQAMMGTVTWSVRDVPQQQGTVLCSSLTMSLSSPSDK